MNDIEMSSGDLLFEDSRYKHTKILTKFHKDWMKTVTSTVYTNKLLTDARTDAEHHRTQLLTKCDIVQIQLLTKFDHIQPTNPTLPNYHPSIHLSNLYCLTLLAGIIDRCAVSAKIKVLKVKKIKIC
ncbi:hypothetical protein DPMN_094168 [Dreissena polymorpha]|uniref:Uncharacterized protein n=1 Tax=Dreissena polymorpha TaxID=45954 RepID=A0A9D4R1P9_DREPO|nr:hypothetical protein DPMN_094168 [Dreissena polymorpha]